MGKRVTLYLDDKTTEHAEVVRKACGERSVSAVIRGLVEAEYEKVLKAQNHKPKQGEKPCQGA